MTEDQYPQRKSPRLQDYDYSQEGAYFITICVQNRLNLFGQIVGDQMQHNYAGKMIIYWWHKLPEKYDGITLDAFVIMPNHLHGIILQFERTQSINAVIRWFKTMTTNAYINGVKSAGWRPFNKQLWQRSYHDHIIRDEAGLQKLREYTVYNPALWAEDRFYTQDTE